MMCCGFLEERVREQRCDRWLEQNMAALAAVANPPVISGS